MGFRYLLGGANLAGKPDLVFPKHRASVFVHGCFWHGHNCKLFRYPATREEFWREKIDGNRARDNRNTRTLLEEKWRVAIIWECRIRKTHDADEAASTLASWLVSKSDFLEI